MDRWTNPWYFTTTIWNSNLVRCTYNFLSLKVQERTLCVGWCSAKSDCFVPTYGICYFTACTRFLCELCFVWCLRRSRMRRIVGPWLLSRFFLCFDVLFFVVYYVSFFRSTLMDWSVHAIHERTWNRQYGTVSSISPLVARCSRTRLCPDLRYL